MNAGNPLGGANRLYPSAPLDLYLARGYEGQNVIVIPSRDLVLVHLDACIPPSGHGSWNLEEFISGVIKAIGG